MIYKTLKKVSDVCQVLDKSKYNPSQTINGVTFTKNDDGTFTANGTATANIDYRGVSYNAKENIVAGRKYLMCGCPVGGSESTYYIRLYYLGTDYGNGLIAKLTDSGAAYYDAQIIVEAGVVCDNLVFKPQLFDLTEMYGAGNEPTTVEQFRQDFPEELYDYKPYCFVKSYKTLLKVSDDKIITSYKKSLVCKTKNLFNPLGREDANPIGSWPITKYDVGNVIYRGIAYSGYYQLDESNKCDVTVSGAVITVVQKVANYGMGYIVKCKPNTVYTLSFETNFNVIVSIFLDLEGNRLSETWDFTFTTPNNAYYLLVVLSSTTIGTYFIKNLQLELGDTATDYVPYGYL